MFKLSPLDRQIIVTEALAATKRKLERNTRTTAEIVWLTDRGLVCGATETAKEFNITAKDPVSRETVQKYVSFFRENRRYFVAEKRGRHTTMTEDEEKEWCTTLDQMRGRAMGIDASFAAAVARGIVGRNRPRLIEEEAAILTAGWARDRLKALGYRVRRATTDRCCTPREVVAAGATFYTIRHLPRMI